jgi:hypothetical protein
MCINILHKGDGGDDDDDDDDDDKGNVNRVVLGHISTYKLKLIYRLFISTIT